MGVFDWFRKRPTQQPAQPAPSTQYHATLRTIRQLATYLADTRVGLAWQFQQIIQNHEAGGGRGIALGHYMQEYQRMKTQVRQSVNTCLQSGFYKTLPEDTQSIVAKRFQNILALIHETEAITFDAEKFRTYKEDIFPIEKKRQVRQSFIDIGTRMIAEAQGLPRL